MNGLQWPYFLKKADSVRDRTMWTVLKRGNELLPRGARYFFVGNRLPRASGIAEANSICLMYDGAQPAGFWAWPALIFNSIQWGAR